MPVVEMCKIKALTTKETVFQTNTYSKYKILTLEQCVKPIKS